MFVLFPLTHLYLYKFFGDNREREQQNIVDSTRTKTLDGRVPGFNRIRNAKVGLFMRLKFIQETNI